MKEVIFWKWDFLIYLRQTKWNVIIQDIYVFFWECLKFFVLSIFRDRELVMLLNLSSILLHSRSFETHRSMNNILSTHIISYVMPRSSNHASSSSSYISFWRHLHDKQNLRIVFNELGFHDRSIIYDLWPISSLSCEWVITKEGTMLDWQKYTY